MAKSNGATAATRRSTSINLTAEQGRNALAAWRGLYHLFGARVESPNDFNVTPDGVEITNFSVSGDYDPEMIVRDISSRERRLDLLATYEILRGGTPEPFADAGEITAWQVQFYKGAVEEGSARTPAYVKQATANYKSANNLAKKRGPKPKVIRLNDLDNLDESALEGISSEALAKLQATIEHVLSNKPPMAAAVTTS